MYPDLGTGIFTSFNNISIKIMNRTLSRTSAQQLSPVHVGAQTLETEQQGKWGLSSFTGEQVTFHCNFPKDRALFYIKGSCVHTCVRAYVRACVRVCLYV